MSVVCCAVFDLSGKTCGRGKAPVVAGEQRRSLCLRTPASGLLQMSEIKTVTLASSVSWKMASSCSPFCSMALF
jgi:hypothetical protein